MVVSRRSFFVSATSQSPYKPLNRMFACVSTTPFGREVVPDVKMISAGSSALSGRTSSSSAAASARSREKSRRDPSRSRAARASSTPSTLSSCVRATSTPLGQYGPLSRTARYRSRNFGSTTAHEASVRSSTNAASSTRYCSVSYTHLDVYKRQLRTGAPEPSGGGGGQAARRALST